VETVTNCMEPSVLLEAKIFSLKKFPSFSATQWFSKIQKSTLLVPFLNHKNSILTPYNIPLRSIHYLVSSFIQDSLQNCESTSLILEFCQSQREALFMYLCYNFWRKMSKTFYKYMVRKMLLSSWVRRHAI
jgi:hypothetical protein